MVATAGAIGIGRRAGNVCEVKTATIITMAKDQIHCPNIRRSPWWFSLLLPWLLFFEIIDPEVEDQMSDLGHGVSVLVHAPVNLNLSY
jgi:hypothetical protein